MSCSKDTTFQRYKLERYFDILDLNNNGKVESEDLVLWGEKATENFAEIGNPLTNENKAKLLKSLKQIFNALTLYGFAGKSKSKQRFVGFLVFSSRLPFYRLIFARHVKPVLAAVDVNGDGKVSWEEFYCFVMKPIGMSEEDAKLAFKIIDTNGDGSLSFDEYSTAVISYFTDTEVNKYSFFYGPLENVPEKFSGAVDAAMKSVKDSIK